MVNKQETVEISLESLGLKLSNVPPEFVSKKNEGGSNTSQCSEKNMIFVSEAENDKTGSIAVLEKNLLDTIQSQSLARYKLMHQKSLSMNYKSIISNLTTLELQQKLAEVSQENFRLKEAVEYNNLCMKHVLNNIVSKQAELASVHEARKRKVVDIENLVPVPTINNEEYKRKIQDESRDVKDAAIQTANQEDMGNIPILSAETGSISKMTSLVGTYEKQDQERNMHTEVPSLERQPKTSFKNVPALLTTEDPSFEFGHLMEELQALDDCCAVHTRSRYASISEGLHRCQKIVVEKRNISEIEESLKLLESLICAELIHLRGILIDGKIIKNWEPERFTEFEMGIERMFSFYSLKLREIECLRGECDPITKLQKSSNFDEQKLPETIASVRERKMMLEEAQRSFEQAMLYLTRQREEMNHERIRMESKERELIEANVSLHEQLGRIRESNDILRVQLAVYETDWAEQRKVCEIMSKKENELLDHIRKLEEEKTQWQTAMQCFQENLME